MDKLNAKSIQTAMEYHFLARALSNVRGLQWQLLNKLGHKPTCHYLVIPACSWRESSSFIALSAIYLSRALHDRDVAGSPSPTKAFGDDETFGDDVYEFVTAY